MQTRELYASIGLSTWLGLASGVSAAELPAATHVLKETGVPAGLAVVVGTTDGALEAGLTHGGPSTGPGQGRMLVQGLSLSDEAAVKARKLLFDKTLYGLASVSVVKDAKALPYYDRIVNLLVADLDALGKDAPPEEEIRRVLGYEGVAYLRKGGSWSKTVKPTPQDADIWTHCHYDASRNSVSKDGVVAPPNAMRWLDAPLIGLHTIGGGRISDHTFVQISPAYDQFRADKKVRKLPGAGEVRLWARDVHSGMPLWNRLLCRLPGIGYGRHSGYEVDLIETFVATGGRVYAYDFAAEDQVAMTAWDIRTGEVRKVYDKSVVFRRAGAPPPDAKDKNPDWRKFAQRALADASVLVHDGIVVQGTRAGLVVVDAASGGVLWKLEAPVGTFFFRPMICGDRLIAPTLKAAEEQSTVPFCRDIAAPYEAVEARQLRTGKPLWRFTDFRELSAHDDARRACSTGCREPYLLLLGSRKGSGNMLLLLDTREGKLVWEKNAGMGFWTYCIAGDEIWGGRGSSFGVVDLATGQGKPIGGMPNPGACSVCAMTPNYFIDKKLFFPVSQPRARPAGKGAYARFWCLRTLVAKCGETVTPAYGSVYMVSSHCMCETHMPGTAAFYAVQPVVPVADSRRLATGGPGALDAVERQVNAVKNPAAFAWGKPEGIGYLFYVTYQRAGKTYPIWEGYDRTQTPPVQAGDLELVAAVHEHRLAARRGGREVWNVVAGGRIGSAPVVHKDLAIFGSHDGYVHAVKLRDGSPAWRFLAAPADKRHVVLGQVESAWPVFNVVLDAGRLYCSAGRLEELDGGIHFYCLDPATGAVHWHVKRQRGLDTDRTPGRKRASFNDDQSKLQVSDGRPIFNDAIEVRDGKVWISRQAVVDLADPKDMIVNPDSLVPPGLKS